MKKFVAVLGGLLTLPAFAEVMPTIIQDVTPDEVQETVVSDDAENASQPIIVLSQATLNPNRQGSTNITRATPTANTSNVASRAVPTSTASRATTSRAATTNTVASRTATAQPSASTARTATAATTASRATASRAATSNTVSRASGATSNASNVTARSATPSANTARSATTTSSRVSIAPISSSSQTALYIPRSATATLINTGSSTATTTATTTTMDELAQITDFCKAQYTECMDNFCNVLDDTQGRCSCSPNIENYAETEAALKQATEELQEVAQKIQYIGLSAPEIETLFTQTEAELEMQGRTDSTQLSSDLDSIKKLILDVETNTSFSSTSSSAFDLSGLLNLDFSGAGINLTSIFGDSSNTSSINNQRGEELYKTATTRCKSAVLNECSAQGVDISVITNSYDLEIDKQCIAYERTLTDSNEQMKQTVFNAQTVLQNARLIVAQEKNTYDLRGCINALDSCMQDEFVCGSDYDNCLDPSGKYITNGAIMSGSEPGQPGSLDGIYATWNYGTSENAWSPTGNLQSYIDDSMRATNADNMVVYLQEKIGSNDDGVNSGMCMSVLNQCQDYTYDKNDNYIADNEVVKNFLQRTLVTVKASQDELLSEYAESCTSDLMACLVRNGYNEENSTSHSSNIVAKNACRSLETTCASVLGNNSEDSSNGLSDQVMGNYNKSCASASDCDSMTGFTATCNSSRMCEYIPSGTCTQTNYEYVCTAGFANQTASCSASGQCVYTLIDGILPASACGNDTNGETCYLAGVSGLTGTNELGTCSSTTGVCAVPASYCISSDNGTACQGGECHWGECVSASASTRSCLTNTATACDVNMDGYIGYCTPSSNPTCSLMAADTSANCTPGNTSACPNVTGQTAYCNTQNKCAYTPISTFMGQTTAYCSGNSYIDEQLCASGSCESTGTCPM